MNIRQIIFRYQRRGLQIDLRPRLMRQQIQLRLASRLQGLDRTLQQQEIDYIEDKDGMLNCYEFKWNPNKKAYLTTTFSSNYPNSSFKLINTENFGEFVGEME